MRFPAPESRFPNSGIAVSIYRTGGTFSPDYSFEGFTLHDSYAPTIFINAMTTLQRRPLILFKEFCKILLGEEGIGSQHELFCHRFAETFLARLVALGIVNEVDNLEDIDEYGTVFGPTVVMAAKEGSLLFRDAFHLLGVNDYTFGCLAERYANL